MEKKQPLDELERLVRLISDDNELLSRASTFMQTLVDSKLDVHGKTDISAQIAEQEKKRGAEGRHL